LLHRHERLTEMKMRLLGDRVSRPHLDERPRARLETFVAEYLAVCKLQPDALITIDEVRCRCDASSAQRSRRGACRP
jgi:hypothetical protein